MDRHLEAPRRQRVAHDRADFTGWVEHHARPLPGPDAGDGRGRLMAAGVRRRSWNGSDPSRGRRTTAGRRGSPRQSGSPGRRNGCRAVCGSAHAAWPRLSVTPRSTALTPPPDGWASGPRPRQREPRTTDSQNSGMGRKIVGTAAASTSQRFTHQLAPHHLVASAPGEDAERHAGCLAPQGGGSDEPQGGRPR